MIIIINICKEQLHYFEFVKPIEDIIAKAGFEYSVVHINKLTKNRLDSANKIIICGTSLRDFNYEKNNFNWIKDYKKPIIGICAGFHAICKVYGFKIKKGVEIGLKQVSFNEEFLGIKGERQVYCLHNNSVSKNKYFYKKFDICAMSKTSKEIQAIKNHTLPIYGVLFHPEVRNKVVLEKFIYI